jgi:hypothetical protein
MGDVISPLVKPHMAHSLEVRIEGPCRLTKYQIKLKDMYCRKYKTAQNHGGGPCGGCSLGSSLNPGLIDVVGKMNVVGAVDVVGVVGIRVAEEDDADEKVSRVETGNASGADCRWGSGIMLIIC